MKAAIVGSSFLLRWFEREGLFEDVVWIDQFEADHYLDLIDADKFDYVILDNIDFLIFTAVISGPDKFASDFDYCWAVNVTGKSHFLHEAFERKYGVLFFSSNTMFGDIPGETYTELSNTRAEMPYGRMKKAIEDEFRDSAQ